MSASTEYARVLLRSLGSEGTVDIFDEDCSDYHPDLEWARSGAMALTGAPNGAPQLAPAPIASCARGVLAALGSVAGRRLSHLDAPAVLGERAALSGLTRRGSTAPGGSCRLMRCADGSIAANLARPDDFASLPALLGAGDVTEPWRFVAERIADRTCAEVVARARLLGLAVSAVDTARSDAQWCRISGLGASGARPPGAPLVVDLSSLWAGPLCTHLLAQLGARVIKVESTGRPDGARRGPAKFFDLLNAGKASVAIDFADSDGRAALHRLISAADIVVESARPRALEQLGIDAEAIVESSLGKTWVSITGYGRRAPNRDWVAFGDDAAAAAGLAIPVPGQAPMFCGDAIADPLTGMHAALAAWTSWREGGGRLVDISLAGVVGYVTGFAAPVNEGVVDRAADGWHVIVDGTRAAVAGPRARRARTRARSLGADTAEVMTWAC